MSVLEVAASDSDGDVSTVQLGPGVASSPSGRPSRAKGATPRELASMLARMLGGATVLLALWLEAEAAALTPDEADAIAEPLARILNRHWKQAAKRLIELDDYAAVSLAIGAYCIRIAPLVAGRMNRNAQPIASPTPPPVWQAQQRERDEPGRNGHSPAVASDGADNDGGVRFSGVAGFGAESA